MYVDEFSVFCYYAIYDHSIPIGGVYKLLEEFQPVKELKVVGDWFVEGLSTFEMGELSYPLLNVKCLTLQCYSKQISGIVNALCCSPALESLVINLCGYQDKYQQTADLDLNNFEEIYRNSNGTVFTCLVSNLKTVKIIGLSYRDVNCEAVLHFIEFLLKNGGALEKIVVILKGLDFVDKVSGELSLICNLIF